MKSGMWKAGALTALLFVSLMVIMALPGYGQEALQAPSLEPSPEPSPGGSAVADVTVEQIQTPSPTGESLQTGTADAAPVDVTAQWVDELLPILVVLALLAIGYFAGRQNPKAAVVYYQDALQRADQTPPPFDDLMVRIQLVLQGYTFVKNEDGSYTVIPPIGAQKPE